MVMKKAQQEEKAKGLIGLKKGKKVAGAPYSVGNYKRKSLNLKDKQLGAAGRKAAAVRGGVKVPISSTRYDTTTKKVYGPAGNLLTGRVNLGGGNIGVYRNGVRVTAKKQPVPIRGGGGGTTTPSRPGGTPNYISGKPDKAGKPKPVRKRGGYVGGRTSMLSQAQLTKRAVDTPKSFPKNQGPIPDSLQWMVTAGDALRNVLPYALAAGAGLKVGGAAVKTGQKAISSGGKKAITSGGRKAIGPGKTTTRPSGPAGKTARYNTPADRQRLAAEVRAANLKAVQASKSRVPANPKGGMTKAQRNAANAKRRAAYAAKKGKK